jgi:hypothetical protein
MPYRPDSKPSKRQPGLGRADGLGVGVIDPVPLAVGGLLLDLLVDALGVGRLLGVSLAVRGVYVLVLVPEPDALVDGCTMVADHTGACRVGDDARGVNTKRSMAPVHTTPPAESSSCTVSPTSRASQQSERLITVMRWMGASVGSVICTHGDGSSPAECHMS